MGRQRNSPSYSPMTVYKVRTPWRIVVCKPDEIRCWIYQYLCKPWVLPPDPGPGGAMVVFRAPKQAMSAFRQVAGGGVSSCVRRLLTWVADNHG